MPPAPNGVTPPDPAPDGRWPIRLRAGLALAAVPLLIGGVTAAYATHSAQRGPGARVGALPHTGPTPSGSSRAPVAPTGSVSGAAESAPARSPSACPSNGWDCATWQRFTAASTYLNRLPGQVGIIVRDRSTGLVWRAGQTGHPAWTASTIKLAIATDLLERAHAGTISLSAGDRTEMTAMLRRSDNDATDALWNSYGADAMTGRFRTAYGMTGLVRVAGDQAGWRSYKCRGEDLLALMSYVLDRLDGTDRAFLVGALRTVAANQHWGVWAAGSALAPGNKDGWAAKPDSGGTHWVTHSVGFAGPGQRYVVVVTTSLPPGFPMAYGIHAVSDLVALAFGRPVPAPVTLP